MNAADGPWCNNLRRGVLFIELDPEIERRLAEFARRAGRSEDSCVREPIEGNIEDLEDCHLAESRLNDRQTSLTSQQVRKEPGLDKLNTIRVPLKI
jgi:predicted DNA-binding protein